MPRRTAGETDSGHVVVVDPENLLAGEPDRIIVGVTALDPRRLKYVQFIRRSGVFRYQRFQEHVVSYNSVRASRARMHRACEQYRENYFSPHDIHRGRVRAASCTRWPSRSASNHPAEKGENPWLGEQLGRGRIGRLGELAIHNRNELSECFS